MTRSRSAAPKQDAATGTWGFVVDLAPGPNGERRQARRRGFRTRREAQEALDVLRVDSRQGTYVPPQNQTMRAFVVDEWLPALEGSIQASTIASYARVMNLWVLPRIGGIRLQHLAPSDLNQLYSHLRTAGRVDGKGGLSDRSVRYAHAVIGRALRDAVKWRRLQLSPATAAEPPRKGRNSREMTTWTASELTAFLEAEAASGSRYSIAWRLLATTGMRRGEALGVRWSDVDLDASRLAIRQTVISIDHKIAFKPTTKTGRPRVIHLDERTVAALKAWRSDQLQERMMMGAGYAGHDLVLCHPDGRPYHPDRFSREFDRRSGRHGAPRIRLHDLRHTWATLALAAGVHPKVVQEQLGHASITITLDTYSHVAAPMKTDAVERVANLLAP